MFEDLYGELERKDGDKYSPTKARGWRTCDLDQVKCIKGEYDKVLLVGGTH